MLVPDRPKAPLGGKPGSALPHQQHAPAVLQHVARHPDRIADPAQDADRTGAQIAAVHDRGIHLDERIGIEHRTTPGVEQWIVLQQGDAVRHDVERRRTGGKQRPAGLEDTAERGAMPRLGRSAIEIAGRARTTVDHQRVGHGARIIR